MITTKRLKLHRRNELEFFIFSCSEVVKRGMPAAVVGKFEAHLKELADQKDVVKIWEITSKHPLLWNDGFSILLPLNVRATFCYYRELSDKERLKKLSKPMKEV